MNGERRVGLMATLAFVATLVAGFGFGVAAERLWFHRRPPGPPRGGPPGMFDGGPDGSAREERFRRGMVDRMTKELGLSPEQRQRVDSIVRVQGVELKSLREEMRPRMQAFFERARKAIDSVLTPEQREKLESIRPRRGDGPPRDGPPPGGPPPPPPR